MIDNEPRTGFLETTGRQSGLPRSTQIGFATDGERIYAIASKGTATDWIKNLQKNPSVRFRIGDIWHAGFAHVATTDDEIATVREAMLEKYDASPIGTDWVRNGLPLVITPS